MPPLVSKTPEDLSEMGTEDDMEDDALNEVQPNVAYGKREPASSQDTPHRFGLRSFKTNSPNKSSPVRTRAEREASPKQDIVEEDQSDEEDGDTMSIYKAGNQKDPEDATASAQDSESSEVEVEDEADGESQTSREDNSSPDDRDQEDCLFCKKPEDQDPSEDFETYLTCTSCSAHSHQQCAREHGAPVDDGDASDWRCPTCNRARMRSESPRETAARSKNSAPRLVRDLLPVSRGVQKPDAHSIFAQPLISEGEEGGRNLRKRKSPTGEPMPAQKRRRVTPRTSAIVDATPMAETLTEDQKAVAHSTRRASQKQVPPVRILQHRPFDKPPPHKFILAFRLEQEKISRVLSRVPRPGRRRDRRRLPKVPPPPVFELPVPKFPALPSSNQIFPSLFERESDSKPYGGILAEADADTSRSLPQFRDREIFEIARKEAEEERRRTSAAAEAQINGEGMNTAVKPSKHVSGPPSKIKCIQFGKFVIDTFYAAPYPEEYSHESRLFICEFCLKYLPSEFVAWRHKLKCPAKHPPGDEIYRDGSVSVWEVDGRKKTEYCQCLCLMAKMFLGSKTLYYDVEPFLFYILTEYDDLGYHFVGYFSKEKRPASMNNVSCILVMPIHQRKGYATFLIDFSYLLTRIEGKEGSPEKPLSDMGLTAYRAYWDLTLSSHLLQLGLRPFSTKTLMDRTGMTADDVVHSLERLYAFIRDPVTKTYAIRYDRKLYESIVNEYETKKHRRLKSEMLVWTPYVMGRSDQAALDGQPLHAIAPREGEEESEDELALGHQQGTDLVNGDVDAEGSSSPEEAQQSRSQSVGSNARQEHAQPDGDAPTDEHGVVAPGPPSTAGLSNPISTELTQHNTLTNGLVDGTHHSTDAAQAGPDSPEETLSGYALAYRTHAIPPTRFAIDPPIPPSMLRQRSIKRHRPAAPLARHSAVVNGLRSVNGHSFASPTTAEGPVAAASVPVRSSPRHLNGSGGKGIFGPDKATVGSHTGNSTPVRRSGRRTGLAAEIASLALLDGNMDQKDVEDSDEEEDEVEPEESGSSDEEESERRSDDDEEEEEEEVSDVDVEEEEESENADAEDEGDDDADAEAEIEVADVEDDGSSDKD